ncbi:MAG TPA: hypothetical protein DC000_06830 [Clostridiales bacterium]|nr:hypothetical protein [Clostridiales bacterium]
MKYKKSNYNIIVEKLENGDILLFNSLSGAFGVLEDNNVDFYEKINILDTDNIDESKKSLVEIMIENGFLIDCEFDEFALLEVQEKIARYSSSKLKNLTIAPTLACNMECKYCFENHENCHGMSEEIKQSLLKFVDSQLCEKGTEHLNVTWFGGEPLLELDTIKFLSNKFIKICNDKNIKYTAGIITNGILLNTETCNSLVNDCKVNSAQITIDGLGDIHNSRRKLKNGEDSFSIIIKNIDDIKDKINLAIRVNVDKNNDKEVDTLIDYFIFNKNWGNDDNISIYLAPIEKTTDECIIKDSKCLNSEEFLDVLIRIYQKLYNAGYKSAFEKMYPKTLVTGCSALTIGSYVIDEIGDIYTCWGAIGIKKYSIGNIAEKLNLNSSWLKWLSLNKPDKCGICKFLPMCKGSCAFKRLENKDKFSCSYSKFSYKEILKYIYMFNYN